MDRLSDQARYPTLSEDGAKMLKFLREHPNAPIFRNQSGNRLTIEDIEFVRNFEREILQTNSNWKSNSMPDWLPDFVKDCYNKVPFYNKLGDAPVNFKDIPTITRSNFSRDISSFVPTDLDFSRLINFQTTGVTGHPLLIPSHPTVAASYLSFLKKALLRRGITLTHARGQVGVLLLGHQQKCFTYTSVTPTMDESGLVKINLHPNDWNKLEDRAKYIDALEAEIYTGDPICFSELLKLPLRWSPKAMFSTSMRLSAKLKERLEQHFGCIVLDLYSMNESSTIAVGEESGHVVLQHKLYIEILDSDGRVLPQGQRGEITLTGGFNPYLPLLRYRTGDYASLSFDKGLPVLKDLEGRPPVRFKTTNGEWINNIDITHSLGAFALSQYKVLQDKSEKVSVWIRDEMPDKDAIHAALEALFGKGINLTIETGVAFEDKVIQYISELEEAN